MKRVPHLISLVLLFIVLWSFNGQKQATESVTAAPSSPQLQYLGPAAGTEYVLPDGFTQFIVKRTQPFRFDNESGPSYLAVRNEEVWAATEGSPPALYEETISYGTKPAACTIEYVTIDSNDDDRDNVFKLDGVTIHTMAEGMVAHGEFSLVSEGELTVEVTDSVGIWLNECNDSSTPTPVPSSTPSPSPTPTATATPAPQHRIIYIPMAAGRNDPPPSPSPTPSPTPPATPMPANWEQLIGWGDTHYVTAIREADYEPVLEPWPSDNEGSLSEWPERQFLEFYNGWGHSIHVWMEPVPNATQRIAKLWVDRNQVLVQPGETAEFHFENLHVYIKTSCGALHCIDVQITARATDEATGIMPHLFR